MNKKKEKREKIKNIKINTKNNKDKTKKIEGREEIITEKNETNLN